ncbi:hypothetical protein F2Q65_13720 [Thiohalocapsa marina]|uniref:Lipoprotein n=1 Tax=Thiohalocapsa marina TaxID=424902 RepID=A0A5M8FJ63_9GAMM|nr:hypothetical protein [Thiohalocapsa marina]KAA6184010.1 hypothetical protein F2Q65_13720 [Thiohalocapsa marina]
MTPYRTLPPLLAALSLAACGSNPETERHYCTLKPGMTIDQLTACGCLLNNSSSVSQLPDSETDADVQRIIIVNYICPQGQQGLASVTVVNGIADAVYQ